MKKNNSTEKINKFKTYSVRLFDICSCKCIPIDPCSCTIQVPIMEPEFLQDQISHRKMMIGGVDHKTTKKNYKVAEKKRIRTKENREKN